MILERSNCIRFFWGVKKERKDAENLIHSVGCGFFLYGVPDLTFTDHDCFFEILPFLSWAMTQEASIWPRQRKFPVSGFIHPLRRKDFGSPSERRTGFCEPVWIVNNVGRNQCRYGYPSGALTPFPLRRLFRRSGRFLSDRAFLFCASRSQGILFRCHSSRFSRLGT